MKVNNKNFTSIWCEDNNRVFIIDQRWLPHEFKTVELTNLAKTVIAIKDMWVRGAPLIGVTAAFGFSLSMITNTSNKNLLKTKQALLETKTLNSRKNKLQEILRTYSADNFNNNTIQ